VSVASLSSGALSDDPSRLLGAEVGKVLEPPPSGLIAARRRGHPLDYTRTMPSLREHLDSPQFTDADGESVGESVVGRFGGNWVKSGVARWKAYLFYTICLVGGVGLVLTSGEEIDIFGFFGIACLALGGFGFIETIRNRPFTKIFGGPVKPK
jgi:hypothetical protein